jgi:hypothetical protein
MGKPAANFASRESPPKNEPGSIFIDKGQEGVISNLVGFKHRNGEWAPLEALRQ